MKIDVVEGTLLQSQWAWRQTTSRLEYNKVKHSHYQTPWLGWVITKHLDWAAEVWHWAYAKQATKWCLDIFGCQGICWLIFISCLSSEYSAVYFVAVLIGCSYLVWYLVGFSILLWQGLYCSFCKNIVSWSRMPMSMIKLVPYMPSDFLSSVVGCNGIPAQRQKAISG